MAIVCARSHGTVGTTSPRALTVGLDTPAVHHFIATPKGMRYNHDLVMDSACHESMKRQFANANDAASRRKLQSTDFTLGELNDVCFAYTSFNELQSFQLTTINNVSKLVWELTTPEPCCNTYRYRCIKGVSRNFF